MTMQAFGGVTSPEHLEEATNIMVASALVTNYYPPATMQGIEMRTLRTGTGLDWIEPQFNQPSVYDIQLLQENDNPYRIDVDDYLQIRPSAIAVSRMILDRVATHVAPEAWMRMGVQDGQAIQNRKNIDVLRALNGSVKIVGAFGNAMNSDLISQVATEIRSMAEAAVRGQISASLHGRQIYDIRKEIVAPGVNAAGGPMSTGLARSAYLRGFEGMVDGTGIIRDDNIDISDDHGRAPVYAREACVMVNDAIMTTARFRNEKYDEGAWENITRSKYGLGLRRQRHNMEWATHVRSNCSALAAAA